jgi:hypothetical protein
MICRMLITSILFLLSTFNYNLTYGQDDLQVWREFINLIKNNKMTVDRIRPHKELGDKIKPTLLGYLDIMRTQAAPEDWAVEPEIVRIENRIHYIIPWTTNNQKVTYCLSFIMEDSKWYFRHMETIFVRLDKITKLPASTFPDVSEAQKAFVREEIYWSNLIINFYLPISKEKGKEYALNMLKDGGGYFVGAKTWVPFSSPHKAFILYMCWEQANLRGNHVTLQHLDDKKAIVSMETHFFALYSITSNLKPSISFDDYKQIFETMWQDRALNAGWNLDIEYNKDYKVTFHFKRKS